MNDLQYSSDKLSFFLIADDINILYADKNIKSLETIVNNEFTKVSDWPTASRLTLNIKKSNFGLSRPYQKKMSLQQKTLIKMKDKPVNLECKNYVKYLIDSNLTLLNTILNMSKTVGMLAKLRHFVPRPTLLRINQLLIFHT